MLFNAPFRICIHSSLIRLVVIFALGISHLISAETSPVEAVRFRTLGAPAKTSDLFYDLNGVSMPVSLGEFVPSAYFNYSNTKEIIFYRKNIDSDGNQNREEAAVADISKSGPRPLLVFKPIPRYPNKYQVSAIATDSKFLPAPSILFINQAERTLDVKCGSNNINLPPASAVSMSMQLQTTNKTETRQTLITTINDNVPVLLYSSNWVVYQGMRTLALIIPDGASIKIIRIVDTTQSD
jgi:hypothetical protein